MGRNRLPLKRLTSSNRRIAYSRRKKGLMKKASELSILCGVEVLLVTFSPGGKPTAFVTENSSLEDVIEKFAQLKPEERAKKKLECLEVVKKACKKFDHHVDIGELFYPGDLSVEDLTSVADSLRTRLSDTQNRLSDWINIENISNVDRLGKMEESIYKSLQDIQRHKLQLVEDLPIGMGDKQELQLPPWTGNGISQSINFDNDLNFLSHRVPECSFESYTNLLCSQEETGATIPSVEDFNMIGNRSNNQLLNYEKEIKEPFEFTFEVNPTDPLDALENILYNNIDKQSEHDPFQCGSSSIHPSWNSSTSPCDRIYPSWESTSATCSSSLFDDLYFPLQSPEENAASFCQYVSPGMTEFPSVDITDKSLDDFFEDYCFDEFLSSGVDS